MRMNEPTFFTAGNTLAWKESDSDHPSPTWTLTYELRGTNGTYTITATQDGSTSGYDITVTSTTTDAYTPGFYRIDGYFTKSGSKELWYSGTITIKANLTEATAGYDSTTHARRTLAAIESAIELYATNPYEQVTIAGRTKIWKGVELYQMKKKYEWEVQREIDAERIAQGKGSRKIMSRMVGYS